jgi:hypothetical protein
VPILSQSESWVEHGEHQGGGDHQGAIEQHEKQLIVCQGAIESTKQLCAAEDASHKNADNRNADSYNGVSMYEYISMIATHRTGTA